ncbi:MAG: hypothetical protein EPN69_13435 [Rhodanobacter sp.]|nr:MAG: hypothetical protein EPN69_13435 [Rhodanobacter sp.]TAM41781.1 MAG: hypothetical protein EPN58_05450 [Rhodanobacter sp.]TAN25863.1 MAG: hypothetical protein EPN32_08610 [Rhodanobacter sp.]
MRATHRILGCTLCLAFTGAALAASLDTQGGDNATHVSASRTSHDSDSSGGDVAGMNRDSGRSNNSEAAASTSRNDNDHSGAAASAPTTTPRPHLGWQSLLPGSIQ